MSTVVGMGEAVGKDSFEGLYRDRYESLVRLGYLLLGSVHDAEEVVQEAFAELHRRWGSIASPGAYVRTAVVNGCRRRQRRAMVARERTASLGAPDPTVLVADELGDAIAALPGRQRTVVVLRYYEDLSEAEIADVLGCRPGTVKSLASRALDQLRKVVNQ